MTEEFIRARNLSRQPRSAPLFHFDVDHARPELKHAFGAHARRSRGYSLPFFAAFIGRHGAELRPGMP